MRYFVGKVYFLVGCFVGKVYFLVGRFVGKVYFCSRKTKGKVLNLPIYYIMCIEPKEADEDMLL